MRAWLVLIILAAVIIAVVKLTGVSDNGGLKPQSSTNTSAPAPAPAPAVTPANNVSSNAPTPPVGQAPPPAPAAPPNLEAKAALEKRLTDLGKELEVSVKVLDLQDRRAHVNVTWMGQRADIGGEYIMLLTRQNVIRDFEDRIGGRPKNSVWYDRNNRRHHGQEFILKLR